MTDQQHGDHASLVMSVCSRAMQQKVYTVRHVNAVREERRKGGMRRPLNTVQLVWECTDQPSVIQTTPSCDVVKVYAGLHLWR